MRFFEIYLEEDEPICCLISLTPSDTEESVAEEHRQDVIYDGNGDHPYKAREITLEEYKAVYGW